MSDFDILELAREAWPPQKPHPHPLRTPQCPILPRIVSAIHDGWTAEQREHVNACEYCQRVTAMVWKDTPPGWRELLRYAADPDTYPDKRAMQIYSEREGKIRMLLARNWVDLVRSAGRSGAGLWGLIDSAWFSLTQLPLPSPALARAQGILEAFEIGGQVPNTDVEIRAYRNSADGFEVGASSHMPALAGRTIRINFVGEESSLSCEIRLDPHSDRLEGAHELGSFDSVVHELGLDCLVTASLEEPASGR